MKRTKDGYNFSKANSEPSMKRMRYEDKDSQTESSSSGFLFGIQPLSSSSLPGIMLMMMKQFAGWFALG